MVRWGCIALILALVSPPGLLAQQRGTTARRPVRGAVVIPAVDPLAAEAAAAVGVAGKLDAFARSIEPRLVPLIKAPAAETYDEIINLASWRQFGEYFARVTKPTPAQIETLKWLTTKPRLRQTLMMAIGRNDNPQDVLKVLVALKGDQGDALETYPDLAAAICVVWDRPIPSGARRRAMPSPSAAPSVDMSRPIELMRYYRTVQRQLRFHPQDLPWQLATYVVSNEVDDEGDAEWALQRYAGRGTIGACFFDVPYDKNQYNTGAPPAIGDKPYTLRNLAQYGGMCEDQAYFASQVARCIGVPAVIVIGSGATDGIGHAWVGYLSLNGRNVVWNFEEGRYPENQYWKGQVTDPQSGERISDADVSLLAELAGSTPRDRMASVALTKLADLADSQRMAAHLIHAIRLSPGNRDAWMQMAEMAARGKLAPAEIDALCNAVVEFAVQEYPDFAFSVLKQANAGRSPMDQIAAMDKMRPLFPRRPDILAAIGSAQGDIYRKARRPNEALAAYGDVLNTYFNIAPVVLATLNQVDQLMRESRNLDRLADIYDTVWKRMPRPQSSIVTRGTPYYQIGQRYEKILRDLNDEAAAQVVRAQLDSMTSTVPTEP